MTNREDSKNWPPPVPAGWLLLIIGVVLGGGYLLMIWYLNTYGS